MGGGGTKVQLKISEADWPPKQVNDGPDQPPVAAVFLKQKQPFRVGSLQLLVPAAAYLVLSPSSCSGGLEIKVLKRVVALLFLTLFLRAGLAACDAPDVEDAKVEVDD